MDVNLLARRAARLAPSLTAVTHNDVIALDSGHAFEAAFPDLTSAAEAALTKYRSETLQYGIRSGLPGLREWIQSYMAGDGAAVPLDEIIVVNGAKQGLELICKLLIDEGDAVVVTGPTYFTGIPILRSFGAEILEVGQDNKGLNVSELAELLQRLKRENRKPPKFIYDVPDFHNPTGLTMPKDRREALLSLAGQHGIFIVEDSPYRGIRFEGSQEPTLKALDSAGIVFALGTFSKLLAPGLRIGWVAAPQGLARRLLQLKADAGTCPLTQRIILEFCSAGRLTEHSEGVRAIYRKQRDHMAAALATYLPEARAPLPKGGFYFWLTLPASTDADQLAKRSIEEGVSILPGSIFYAGSGAYPHNQGPPLNHVRLAYSHALPSDIEEGIQRLARAFKTASERDPGLMAVR